MNLQNACKKVIGARYYDDPEKPGFITTARDQEGHDTHTTSIAAGDLVWGASYKGLAKGIARGGSPTSRIATYCVCGGLNVQFPWSSILKAFDDEIVDGVDVLSVSISGAYDDLFDDRVVVGAFHAAEKGIIVVCSARNNGSSPRKIKKFAPWILVVGATTIDREYETVILLGRKKIIKAGPGGINFNSSLDKSVVYKLVDRRSVGSDLYNASNCILGSLDNSKVKGKIVLCEDNDTTFVFDKKDALMKQGAVGFMMIDDSLKNFIYNYGNFPFVIIDEADGVQVRSYINSTRNPLATIFPSDTLLNTKPAPVVAEFSGRGPTPGIKDLLKPDVGAQGVGILAARPPSKGTLFKFESGTSMACPHVSGLAATVKSQHPTWSPSTIRSAIMTTGRVFTQFVF